MPANSSLPTRLPTSRVGQPKHRLPSFQCYRDPPSLQPALGIPSAAAATPFRPSTGQIPFVISISSASCCIPSPTLSLESKLLLPIDCRWLLDPLRG
ncbi:hypothetical protein GQ55_2G228500 [Panicum hallii var. hallii]|uniref:Uncharacterized protein n=1 Tax=Panicum hallii var. hallii TaxID=1504633 RepID=A0A2T7ERH1_9POAL|nr:hypothetical protein GQ55_2G228500 [Panicum hallii var. hallii]